MHTYVINLARSPERRAHITAELGKTRVRYEMINAVDGRDLDLTDTRVVDPVFAGESEAHPGAIGCALSHWEVYRKILDDDVEIACVLEDDVILPADFDALTDAVVPHMTGAEVVLLNFQSGEPCRVTRSGAVQLPSSRLLVRVADERQVASAGGYLITREACARMVKNVKPVRTVADDWDSFCREGSIDRLRCVVPMAVIQSPDFRTTMSYCRPGSRYEKLREIVAGSRIPILYHALAERRR
ncbi:MAG: glycosyltransferase family 25 protein, partial [Streptosporangiaceae bacterium]|nr:glycosyltransferase family 25 protein [Streptosporangiaceae bacterium]